MASCHYCGLGGQALPGASGKQVADQATPKRIAPLNIVADALPASAPAFSSAVRLFDPPWRATLGAPSLHVLLRVHRR